MDTRMNLTMKSHLKSLMLTMISVLAIGQTALAQSIDYAKQDASKIGQVADIQIERNLTLRYLKAGKGEPLILLHTIRTQLDYFQYVIPDLAKNHTVYALDLPGHGYSSIDTNASYDEPYLRKAVVSFIEKQNLKGVSWLVNQ